MATIRRMLQDERSAIAVRHAAIASVLVAAGASLAIFLALAGDRLYERTSERTLWAASGTPHV